MRPEDYRYMLVRALTRRPIMTHAVLFPLGNIRLFLLRCEGGASIRTWGWADLHDWLDQWQAAEAT